MYFVKTYYEKFILIVAGIFVFILRFVSISFPDIYGDGAINSFRAFGWLDWLLKSGQSTPFEWLGFIPPWAYLSFHDAPPLAFFIQHIFFIFGGNGVITARLPFVLTGVGSILLTFILIRKLANFRAALITLLFFSVISYSVWSEHSMYLEGILGFFITASILLGAIFLFRDRKIRNLYLFVIFVALAIITKYTAIFLIPTIFIYLLLYRKKIFQYRRQLIKSIVFFLIILSPVVIYNIKVYSLRGHFDAALSSMVGMHPEDFSIISSRTVSFDLVHNFIGIFKTLAGNMSFPLVVLAIASLVYLVWKVVRSRNLRTFDAWITVNTFFLIILFTFAGVADRFISVFVPLIAISIGLFLSDIWGILAIKQYKFINFLTIFAVCLIFVIELVYSFNTNVLKKPFSYSPWLYSPNKLQNLGFNQLESYIRNSVIIKLPKINPVRKKEDTTFTNKDVEGRSVVIFDDRILWFSQMWYFQRYYLYYRWPFISTAFIDSLKDAGVSLDDLRKVSGQETYFIYPTNSIVMDEMRVKDKRLSAYGLQLANYFENLGAKSTIIENGHGVPVFKVLILGKINQ